MTIDEAIAHVGPNTVTAILRSGVAFDDGTTSSFRGRALCSWLAHNEVAHDAYLVLAAAPESLLWQACRPESALREAFLEGSGRAMNELLRRGSPLPQSAELQPAWL